MKYILDIIVFIIGLICLIIQSIVLILWNFELNPVFQKADGYFKGRRLADEWMCRESKERIY